MPDTHAFIYDDILRFAVHASTNNTRRPSLDSSCSLSDSVPFHAYDTGGRSRIDSTSDDPPASISHPPSPSLSVTCDPFYSQICTIPKQGVPFGEDMYLSTKISPRCIALGVFDGVGNWSNFDIDPTEYTRVLIDHLCDQYLQNYDEEFAESKMKSSLSEAHGKAVQDCRRSSYFGTTTVSMCVMNDNILHTLNMGDSAILVLRRFGNQYHPAFQTEVQQHGYNTPYQLGVAPSIDDCYSLNIDTRLSVCQIDQPEESVYQSFRLVDDDIIIVGSDGLFDNMGMEYICSIVEDCVYKHDAQSGIGDALLKSISHRLAHSAKHNAIHGQDALSTGKDDDITVVVSQYRAMYGLE